MSLRTFIFCDACNQESMRVPEMRRSKERGTFGGRRQSDGKAWLEYDASTSLEQQGWHRTESGVCLCYDCKQEHNSDHHLITPHNPNGEGREFIFCDCCNPMGVRQIETFNELSQGRPNRRRRILDLRSWFDGDTEHAMLNGWASPRSNLHYCPNCCNNHPELLNQQHVYIA